MNNFSSSETSDNSDEYYNITQADLDRAKFRIGRNPSKRSITLLLADLIEYFKSRRKRISNLEPTTGKRA